VAAAAVVLALVGGPLVAAVPVVLGALQRAGINASSVAVARPSLDDVYLRHTGRRYSESQTSDDRSDRELVEASN